MSFKTAEGEAIFKAEYEKNLKLWPVPFETFYVPTSYGETHIIAAGAEELPPMILLHSFGMASTIWYKNISSLTQHFRVFAVDVLGDMNLSEPVKSLEKSEDIAQWMCEILDALKIEKASVIGHSAGGYETLNFVVHAPHRVNQIVLLAPAASFVPFHKQFFLRLVLINIFRSKAFINRFFRDWVVTKQDRVKDYSFDQFIYGILHYKWKVKPAIPTVIPEEKLKTIQVPTLLLIGEEEVIYNPFKATARAKQLIPHIEAKIIPQANHFLLMEQADIVNNEMLQFLLRDTSRSKLAI